jgi:hypothetical protein
VPSTQSLSNRSLASDPPRQLCDLNVAERQHYPEITLRRGNFEFALDGRSALGEKLRPAVGLQPVRTPRHRHHPPGIKNSQSESYAEIGTDVWAQDCSARTRCSILEAQTKSTPKEADEVIDAVVKTDLSDLAFAMSPTNRTPLTGAVDPSVPDWT